MAKNIEMNWFNGSRYEPLYPSTTVNQVSNLQNLLNNKLSLSGGTLNGALNMGGYNIENLADPVSETHAVNLRYLTNYIQTYERLDILNSHNATGKIMSIQGNYVTFSILAPSTITIEDGGVLGGFIVFAYTGTGVTKGTLRLNLENANFYSLRVKSFNGDSVSSVGNGRESSVNYWEMDFNWGSPQNVSYTVIAIGSDIGSTGGPIALPIVVEN